MAEWFFGREQGGCAWLGRGPGKRSERRSRHKAICPNAMRSFWKVAAFRLTESTRDTIRQTRLALLPEGAAPFYHFNSKVVLGSGKAATKTLGFSNADGLTRFPCSRSEFPESNLRAMSCRIV